MNKKTVKGHILAKKFDLFPNKIINIIRNLKVNCISFTVILIYR